MKEVFRENFFLVCKMMRLGLIVQKSLDSNGSDQYYGLIWRRARSMGNIVFPAKLSPLNLSQTNDNFEFQWTELNREFGFSQPARMTLINTNREPINNYPLDYGEYYLSMPFSNVPSAELKYYPLKIIGGNFAFVDENPDQNTVKISVPSGQNLKTNDTQTDSFLKVGDNLLSDIIRSCSKLYLSPYLNNEHVPDPNENIIIVGSSCIPNCIGKKCSDDDGCGNICGCGDPSEICNPQNGLCESPPPTPICETTNDCGDNGGICQGPCPNNQNCTRNVDGFAECLKKTPSVSLAIFGIIFILFLVLFILVLLMGLEELL